MRNLDANKAAYEAAADKVVQAAEGEDKAVFMQAMTEFAAVIQQQVLTEAEEARRAEASAHDAEILGARGVRTLTTAEQKYWESAIAAMRSDDPKQAVANLTETMPTTVIESVFEEVSTDAELIGAIDFVYGAGLTKYILDGGIENYATWSPLCAAIATEIVANLGVLDVGQNKLSAFIPVCNAMLDLGPAWVDRYVREVMVKAITLGLTDGVINGRGVVTAAKIFEPIGMRKNLEGAVDPVTGYPDKEAIAVTSFDPASYGALLARLTDGGKRDVGEVLLICNPTDYYTKVMPATTVLGGDGLYKNGQFPHPTRVIRTSRIGVGEALLGIGKRYLMIAGTDKNGKLEYSDHAQFLEDTRVYRNKVYANGQPKDNASFLLLDISGLKPASIAVATTPVA